MKTASAAEAKARFAELVREAENGASVVITRHGKPVVALVSARDLAELDRLRSAGTRGGLAGVAGGWKGSDELVMHVRDARRTPARKSPRLDE